MAKAARGATPAPDVGTVLERLRALASKEVRDGLARYAIPADKALGVAVGDMRKLAKEIGRDHGLAQALWATDIYDARMLAVMVDQPAEVDIEQMERWCRDFDNWAICDTACFDLFDKTPHAFGRVHAWATREPEFEKRAAFALLASLALHDKRAADQLFLETLPLIEAGATDQRNFVKKGVSWALRAIGKRKSKALKNAALELAQRLADSSDKAARWVGKDGLRDLVC